MSRLFFEVWQRMRFRTSTKTSELSARNERLYRLSQSASSIAKGKLYELWPYLAFMDSTNTCILTMKEERNGNGQKRLYARV